MGSNPTSSDFNSLTMFFYLKASSKDLKVLHNFIKFLSNLKTAPVALKYFSGENKRKSITILNSPHVNKTAQEHFEYRYYKKQFLITSFKPFSLFLLLKKIKNSNFPGLNLEIKGLLNKNKSISNPLRAINPNNIVLNFRYLSNLDIKKKRYIQLFDCYGETYLKNFHYNRKSFY